MKYISANMPPPDSESDPNDTKEQFRAFRAMVKARYSTEEVAKILGIDRANLQRLIRQKRIPVPPLARVGRLKIRLWTKTDIENARKALKKKE